jgi:antitoxin (DNA-binding transcriptional repressor) of toxin-antitoxin stability system
MPKDISIKQLRENLADIADQVERGETFRVIRRSKPSFMIMNIDADVSEEDGWETVVDFTEGGKKRGMPVKDVIKILKKLRR